MSFRAQTRSYDPTSNSQTPPYHADLQFTGMGGQIVFRQSPGSGATITVLDSLARPVSVKTIVPQDAVGDDAYDFEVAKTDYAYDTRDGNQIEVLRLERIVDAMSASPSPGTEELGQSNAVRTRTLNWFDHKKRLVASAELGTQEAKFTSDGTYPTRPNWYNSDAPPTINTTTGAIEGADDMSGVPLTVYHFDRHGNMDYQADPMGVVTRTYYSGTGKVQRRIENYFGASDEQRETRYEYRFGQLFTIEAVTLPGEDPDGAPAESQISAGDFGLDTEGEGGAEIVDTDFEPISRSGAPVFALRLPDPETGDAGETASIAMRYDFQGRLAERTDERGITIRYRYDDLDRLSSLEVGHFNGETYQSGYPAGILYAAGLEPASRIAYIEYEYADDMRTYTATAWSKRDPQGGGDGELISQVKQEFDGRGNLWKDWQSLGTEIVSGTPKTEYEWDVDYTASMEEAGHTRLSAMLYPKYAVGNHTRTVTFGYGTAHAMPDELGHARLVESSKNSVTKEVAMYGWVGTGRRAYRTFAEESGSNVGGTQDYKFDQVMELQNGQIGLIGLDPWGRVATLTFHTGGPAVFSPTAQGTFIYTYDLAGRRLTCARNPDPWTALPNGGTEKQIDDYDALSRLIGFKATNYNGSTTRIEQDWDLDLLGNWDDRTTTTPSPTTTVSHTTDERNRIESIETTIGNNSPTTVNCIYDAAGNVSFDGTYAYQYDAWNRLVSIHAASLNGNGGIVLGALQKHHTYDAIGRLARTLSPYPSPAQQSGEALRSERFYYDGIRRLVEVQIDTVKSLAGALASGNQAYINLADAALDLSDGDIDQSAAPAAYEVAYIAAASPTVTTPREYVWGPGDKGIYELVCQFDGAGAPIWPWQDEGGDVVGACDAGGASGASRLVGVWSYGPYGEVLKDATVVSHAAIHAGHKGLFVDRLDAGVAGIGGSETARLATGATHSVFANNRHLLPKFGRWAQMDPNASGLVLLASACSGGGIDRSVSGADLGALYGNVASLYQYGASSPWTGGDPLGLTWDPFEWHVDDYLMEDAGSKAAFLTRTVGAAHTAAYLATYIGSWVPIPIIALPAAGINMMLGMPDSLAQSEAWRAIERTGDVVGLAMLGRSLGRFLASSTTTAAYYANNYGWRGTSPRTSVGITARAMNRLATGEVDRHHALAKFLRGDPDGLTVEMNRLLHQNDFHPTLMAKLGEAGVRRGALTWSEYFRQNPQQWETAINVLFDVSRGFERHYGHLMNGSLTQAIWQQLMKQDMVLAP